MNAVYKAKVKDGRLVLDEPTALPEGTEIELIAAEDEETLAQAQKNQAALSLLRSWREEGDEEEQRETVELLKKSLDEARPSGRKLFPG